MIYAIREVGLKIALKFLLWSVLQIIYGMLSFPVLRKQFLEILGAKIGESSILMNVKFFNWHHIGPKGLKIGNRCFIGDETLIDLYGPVTLEDEVTVAQRVTILTHTNVGYRNHPLQKLFPRTVKGIHIKRGAVVGASSTLLPGVIIGEESFIAAGSVVTKRVPPKALTAGVPAKIIRRYK